MHDANPALPAGYDRIFERALAKDPRARHATASELVGELRRGLHDDAGDTWVAAPPRATAATRVAPARTRNWWPAGLLALPPARRRHPRRGARRARRRAAPQARTVMRTVTTPGRTVRQTITTEPATTTAAPAGASGAALNNAGYAKMRAGDFGGALPLLRQAVEKLNGTGSTDEAYADYNLAYSTLAVGQCTDVLSLLDRSESVQGHRPEISRLRHDAKKRCR